ncbi:MAG: hypothetical protein LQ352_004488, partial [Teloschistes flavicans]
MWPLHSESVNTWATIDKQKHARKRRILNAAFSDKALRSSEPYIVRHTDRWCELSVEDTGTRWSRPIDMVEWANAIVFDILGDLLYARSYDIKEPGPNDQKDIPKLISEFVMAQHSVNKFNELTRPKTMKTYLTFVVSCITQRIKAEEVAEKADSRKDMFHHVFHAKDLETGNIGYARGELFGEIDLLLMAGSDTTTTALAALFFYLTRYPHVYAKLTAEVRSAFARAEDIRAGQQLASLRYLRACIDETMRMSPPAASDPQREVLPGGLTVDGHHFPPGTNVAVMIYALHQNEDAFKDPAVFRPERWIVNDALGVSADGVAAAESAFSPFS